MKQKKVEMTVKSYTVDRRIRIFLFMITAVFTIVVFRLWTIQVYQQKKYQTASLGNIYRTVPIQSVRGEIRDRNGKRLVKDESYRNVWIALNKGRRRITPAVRTSLELLSEILEIPYKRLESIYLTRKRDSKQLEVCVATRIPPQKYVALEERLIEFPEEAMIFARKIPTRYYLHGSLASHILGHTGPISPQDQQNPAYQDYAPYSLIGKSGIEKQYEKYLHGSDGLNRILVNTNEIQQGPAEELQPATAGNNVVLTLDYEWQYAAEQILGVSPGVIIVSDPRDNSILAMASYPRFDPNNYSQYLTAPGNPLVHRAVQGKYEPGSVIKIFEAFALLEELHLSPETEEFCPGYYSEWGERWNCHVHTGHGNMDLYHAICLSCNVYFYKEVGYRLNSDKGRRLRKWMQEFGFENQTGIDLPDEPKASLFPSIDTMRGWTRGVGISNAIGQGGVLFTPLQVSTALCAIANGGTLYKPRVAQRIINSEGKIIQSFEPEIAGTVNASTETFEIVKKAMWEVVNNPRGTGRRVNVFKDFILAGKTGTAQAGNGGEPHAWFVCYGPYENPEIAITVMVENSGHGGEIASPLARQFLDVYLGNTKIEELVAVAETEAYRQNNTP